MSFILLKMFGEYNKHKIPNLTFCKILVKIGEISSKIKIKIELALGRMFSFKKTKTLASTDISKTL